MQPLFRTASTSVPQFLLRQLGIDRLLDVPDVRAAAEIPVDEAVHVADLEFDRRPDVVEPDDPGEIVHDFQAPLDTAPMVVRHFEHEKLVKNISVHNHAFVWYCFRGHPSAAPV